MDPINLLFVYIYLINGQQMNDSKIHVNEGALHNFRVRYVIVFVILGLGQFGHLEGKFYHYITQLY
jgi:hypothetical protein